ncbi:MAG: aspartate aminotransferase family protein [Desulfobacterales bacterium]|jgi:glutamate-1-semialdehyde 2,1-aminomutase
MTLNTEKSQRIYERAKQVLVEGVNSPSRGGAFYKPCPIFIDHGQGGKIYDVDGNEYVDLMLGFSALILGHAHPEIVTALERAANKGTHYAAAAEIEVKVAEKMCQLIPSAEKVRFANSGTEATMAAIRLARGYTGRKKFIKFEGQYHGWYDAFLLNCHARPMYTLGTRKDPVSIPDSSGLTPASLSDTIMAPWNDIEIVEEKIKQYKGQIAAVITEPIMSNIGFIPPKPGYLKALRQVTRDNDILLIMDEVVTGFRYAPGGCQEYFGVVPDISTFGKALGAGIPIGAVVGKKDIMEAFSWGKVLHYGTFNATRLAMEVVDTNIDVLTRDANAGIKHLHYIGDQIIAGLKEIFEHRKMPAIAQGFGPMFQLYFTQADSIDDYRDYCSKIDTDKYSRFAHELLKRGVYSTVSNGLHSIACIAHTEEDVASVLNAADDAIASM